MNLLFSISVILLAFVSSNAFGQNNSEIAQYLYANHVQYDAQKKMISATGHVSIIKDQYILNADKILYDFEHAKLLARGNVLLQDNAQNVIYGDKALFKGSIGNHFESAILYNFIYQFPNKSILAANVAKGNAFKQASLHFATFTPCSVFCGGMPIWQISAQESKIDLNTQTIKYKNAFFEVFGVPIFYTPYFAHPTPNAKPKSGILMPKIKNRMMQIPVYVRTQPNWDLTINPSLGLYSKMIEAEFRHKVDDGDYSVNAHHGFIIYDKNGQKLRKKTQYLSGVGNFNNYNTNYGFDLQYLPNKAYMKHFLSSYEDAMKCKLYLQKVDNKNYFSVSTFYLHSLVPSIKEQKDVSILPEIKTKNIFTMDDDENLNLIVENSFTSALFDVEPHTVQKAHSNVSMNHRFITSSGHVFNTGARSVFDIFYYNKKNLNRIIPELSLEWLYPLVSHFKHWTFILEPTVSSTIGQSFNPSFNKFIILDEQYVEIADHNLFLSNRFSGIESHEYGQRLNLGINLNTIILDKNNINLFVGKTFNKHNVPINALHANVIKLQLQFSNNNELFYKTTATRDQNFNKQEIGIRINYAKASLASSYMKLKIQDNGYSKALPNWLLDANNEIVHIHNELQYQINDNWFISDFTKFNLVNSKKIFMINHGINLVYTKDCIKFITNFRKEYTQDIGMSMPYKSSFTFAIGLKMLNFE